MPCNLKKTIDFSNASSVGEASKVGKLHLGIIYISLPISFLLAPVHVICSVIRERGNEEEERPQTQRHAASVPLMTVRSFAVCYNGQSC